MQEDVLQVIVSEKLVPHQSGEQGAVPLDRYFERALIVALRVAGNAGTAGGPTTPPQAAN